MSLYQQLKHCKPKNIILEDLEGLGYRVGNRFFISTRYSIDKQVLTLIHELVHGFPEFEGLNLGKNIN